MTLEQIKQKTRKVIESCETKKQAQVAERYLDLVCLRNPHIDMWDLRTQLNLLFNASVYE